eukprot:gene9928-12173_t
MNSEKAKVVETKQIENEEVAQENYKQVIEKRKAIALQKLENEAKKFMPKGGRLAKSDDGNGSSSSSPSHMDEQTYYYESRVDRIIREQDEEYEKALLCDRIREQKLKEKKEAEELKKEEHRQRILNLKKNLKPEPSEGTITKILIKLPDGSNLTRKYLVSDTIQDIMDFVIAQDILKTEDFNLATPVPKCVYNDPNVTLEEANLHPSASLYVKLK